MNNFKSWLKFNENVGANWQDWLDALFKYAKPQENQTIVLAKLGLQPGNKNKNIIEQVLKEKNLENFNWFSFCLGHLARSYNKMYRKEDLELAIDVTKKRIDNGDLSKSEVGTKGWLTIGFESINSVEKHIEDSQKISKRQERKLRKKGSTLADDEKLIKLVAQEGNYKLYLAPKIEYKEQKQHPLYSGYKTAEYIEPTEEEKESRKRILCKYGKGTKWCTAIPDGTYHENYIHNNIYIVHENDIPFYQFVDCNDENSDNHQFMDKDDHEVKEIDYNIFEFLNKHATSSINCYDQKVIFSTSDFFNPKTSDALRSKISGRGLANILNDLIATGSSLTKAEDILKQINLKFSSQNDAYQFIINVGPDLLYSRVVLNILKSSIKILSDNWVSQLISLADKSAETVGFPQTLQGRRNATEIGISTKDMLKLIGNERLKKLRPAYIFDIIQKSSNLEKIIEELGPEIVSKIKEDIELLTNWLIFSNDIKNLMESLGDETLSYLTNEEISRIMTSDYAIFKDSMENIEYFINKFKSLGKGFNSHAVTKMFFANIHKPNLRKIPPDEYVFNLIRLFGKENVSKLYHDAIKKIFEIVGKAGGEEGKKKLAKLFREYYMRPKGPERLNTFVWSDYAKTENLLTQYD